MEADPLRTVLVLLVAALALPALLPPGGASHALGFSGTFTTADGVSSANVLIGNVCAGSTTLTVELTPLTPGAPSGTRSAVVKNVRLPDPCGIACYDCPFAWSWTMAGGTHVLLQGGGAVAGGAGGFALSGRFHDGVLEFGVPGVALAARLP